MSSLYIYVFLLCRLYYPPVKRSHASTIRAHNRTIASRAARDQAETELQERMKKYDSEPFTNSSLLLWIQIWQRLPFVPHLSTYRAAHQAHIRAWHENSVKTMANRQEIRRKQMYVMTFSVSIHQNTWCYTYADLSWDIDAQSHVSIQFTNVFVCPRPTQHFRRDRCSECLPHGDKEVQIKTTPRWWAQRVHRWAITKGPSDLSI